MLEVCVHNTDLELGAHSGFHCIELSYSIPNHLNNDFSMEHGYNLECIASKINETNLFEKVIFLDVLISI